MEKEYRILTECYLDFMLMKAIAKLLPNDLHSGINEIGRNLEKRFGHQRAVVLIDDDKKKEAKFLREYEVLQENVQEKIKLLKHPKKPHYAIQISPASEAWILDTCHSAGINASGSSYRLPATAEKLKSLTGHASILHDKRMLQLLNTLHQKDPQRFRLIREWIREAFAERPRSKVVKKRRK